MRARQTFQLGGYFIQRILFAATDDDGRALASERLRSRLSDTAAPAGDNCDFVVELAHRMDESKLQLLQVLAKRAPQVVAP